MVYRKILASFQGAVCLLFLSVSLNWEVWGSTTFSYQPKKLITSLAYLYIE